mmetsp:Transcript_33601/g.105261  ORF Transcript_33601/g.105261 Transcript_33601/m.105261 type:complete len:274 (+) Transcript_33601:460-1281(+)
MTTWSKTATRPLPRSSSRARTTRSCSRTRTRPASARPCRATRKTRAGTGLAEAKGTEGRELRMLAVKQKAMPAVRPRPQVQLRPRQPMARRCWTWLPTRARLRHPPLGGYQEREGGETKMPAVIQKATPAAPPRPQVQLQVQYPTARRCWTWSPPRAARIQHLRPGGCQQLTALGPTALRSERWRSSSLRTWEDCPRLVDSAPGGSGSSASGCAARVPRRVLLARSSARRRWRRSCPGCRSGSAAFRSHPRWQHPQECKELVCARKPPTARSA